MIRFVSLLFFLGVFLSVTATLNAQNSTPPGEQNRIETKERVDQKQIENENARLEMQTRNEERNTSQEVRLKQQRQERIQNHWGMLEKRIEATIERLEILIARIESRLVKIAQNEPGVDTAKIEADIDTAKDLLAEAGELLDESAYDLKSLIETENPKLAFSNLKGKVMDIKDLLIEAHRILVYVIGDIKGLRVGSESLTQTPNVNLTPAIDLSPTNIPDVIE